MSDGQQSRFDEIADTFRWILASHYPTAPKQKAHTIRIVVGPDEVDESECELDENIVSVSGSGIRFWFRPYSEPGAQRFAFQSIDSLFDFMRVVIWPRVTDDWATERLLSEQKLEDIEKKAIDKYRQLKTDEKSLILRDIGSFLSESPVLSRLFAAIQLSDVQTLNQIYDELPSELLEIESHYIRDLGVAISNEDEKKVTSLKRYLIFWIMQSAAKQGTPPSWQSPEFNNNAKQIKKHLEYLGKLARQRYAREFMAFCLSEKAIELNHKLFATEVVDGHAIYLHEVTSFVQTKLATPEYTV